MSIKKRVYMFFLDKKNQKPRGVPNSPRTPNGQGVRYDGLSGYGGGLPCTHPYEGVMGYTKK